MNAIDPSNNSSGGKVKFFTGGSGGSGQTIQMLPIIFGSNNMTTDSNGGMLPLNATYFINDGGDNPAPYIDDVNAVSHLPSTLNQFYYYKSNGNIRSLLSNNVDVAIDLYINGVVIETLTIVLNSGNSYRSDFSFSFPPSLNSYTAQTYGIRVRQTSGTGTQFLVSTTNVFLSPYNLQDDLESEFFSSSNFNGLEFIPDAISYLGLGGQTNTNDVAGVPLVKSIVSDQLLTEIVGFYFVLSQSVDTGFNSIYFQLFIDDVLVETRTYMGTINAYEIIKFDLPNALTVSSAGNVYLKFDNSTNYNVYLFEAGVYGNQLN